MASNKKTWIWIIVALFGLCVVAMMAIAGAGIYFVSKHIDAARTTGAEALHAFDAARGRFKEPPLFELDQRERLHLRRDLAELPTGATRPESLRILAWDPSEEKLVKVSLPFWILRLGHRKIEFMRGDRGVNINDLNLDVRELERIGPALLVDHRASSGERVLIWTQ